MTGQKFKGVGLKLTAVILTFGDPSSHLCQKNMRVAVLTDLELGSCSRIWNFSNTTFLREPESQGGHFQNSFLNRDLDNGTRTVFQNLKISKIKYSVHSE